MSSVHSVQPGPDVSAFGRSHRARVRVVTHDPFGTFARVAARQRARRLTIVSPWVSVGGPRFMTLGRLVERAERHGASVILVTRPPQIDAHEEAIELVLRSSRGVVHLVPGLHAKLYVCEPRLGRGFAVMGSANASDSSIGLAEVALVIRPERGSSIINELAGPTVRGLLTGGSPRR